jgi:hypothetical protein
VFVTGHLDVGSTMSRHSDSSGSWFGRGTVVVVIVVVEIEVSELSPGAAQSGGGTSVDVTPRCGEHPGGGSPMACVDNVISLLGPQ